MSRPLFEHLRATTTRRLTTITCCLVVVFIVHSLVQSFRHDRIPRPSRYFVSPNYTHIARLAFQSPESGPYRLPDTVDTFADYKHRSSCNISSLDLHGAFGPLCVDRKAMLAAMSGGGRIGKDAPYMPRGCDMRWFTSEEVCEILGRFEKVIIVGDSMMRHVIGSMNVLIRKDLGYGAVTDWNFSPQERKDCFCNYQTNVKSCSIQGIFKTADVVKNDPDSVSCPAGTVDLMIEQMIRFPIPNDELTRFRELLPSKKPTRPYAFVFGHGLWNDLDLQATLNWLDTILDSALSVAPWLQPTSMQVQTIRKKPKPKEDRAESQGKVSGIWPRLFVTPNAAGREKPDEWLVSQGNKALMIFEEAVAREAARRGVEHLGTWNMTIQANKYDGVHVDLRGNMIKAMMILNWLNLIEVENF